jgi:LRR receptor-like serine/threonine-protein kinase FLS2
MKLILFILCCVVVAVSSLSNDERASLRSIGKQWPQLGWSGEPSCEWRGLDCNDAGNVVSLVSSGNGFTSPMPREIGGLQHMSVLILDSNDMPGVLPDELGTLKNLTSIDLMFNRLQAPLPDSLGSLTRLTGFDLDDNLLDGALPEFFCRYRNMSYISVPGNALTELPECVGRMPSLTSLSAFDNRLTRVPRTIDNVAELTSYMIGGNPLEGGQRAPEFLAGASKLRILWLQAANFVGLLPAWLWTLPELNNVDLSNNQFFGTLPAEMPDNFAEMNSLKLANNSLSGVVPAWICNDTAHNKVVELEGNNFACPLPSCCSTTEDRYRFYRCGSCDSNSRRN